MPILVPSMIEARPPKQTAARQDVRLRGLTLAVLLAAVGLSVGGYLLASRGAYGLGYPLDDAWIHQTYARSLAQHGEWAFIPGQPSAGSTAPLWSVLLAAGYGLGFEHRVWAYLLGGLSLFGLVLAGESLLRAYHPTWRGWLPWAGLFLAGEWHMAWAAVSGMETALAGLSVVFVLLWVYRAQEARLWALVGLLVGISMWVRPDALTLLGPAGFTLWLGAATWRERTRGLLALVAGLAVFLLPYLLFNLLVQGSLWPNTFYAKQAEYAVQRQLPLLSRFLSEVSLPLVGAGLFLLPGFAAFTWRAWRARCWPALAAVLWFLGYGLLYALRLPVAYQYGRYFMPAMPVYFVTGLAGTAWLLERLRRLQLPLPATRMTWIFTRVGVLSAVLVWLAFYGIGAGRYAQDVAIIETEMVAAAKWIAANTQPEALIAAHDIGALGYFSERQILDLAGLVSPQVIPFIRDEPRLAAWLDAQGADYLIVFPGWYTQLAEGKELVYQTGGLYAPQAGGSNMVIYRWRP